MLKEGWQALRSGHWPGLLGAWLHFEVSFMVWLLIGALSIAISDEFSLSASQKGMLVGMPLLGGAFLRIIVGPLGDWFGAKTIGLVILGLETLGLLLGWQWGTSFEEMLVVGLFLGVAGASFAIALPLASQAYSTAHQGLAMGVAALGNSGVLLASFFAPRIAEALGWHHVFGLMLMPVLCTTLVFSWLVKPSPCQNQIRHIRNSPRLKSNFRQGVRDKLMYWLCFLYAVTFGGFVGLSSYLPIYFHDQFQVGMVAAGTLTALSALAGSAARPLGGFMADKLGGFILLPGIFVAVMVLCITFGSFPNLLGSLTIVLFMMMCLGFGNGVIFQVASHRFKAIMGTASGLIGAAGGLGGFLLPFCFGWLKEITGTFSAGFLVFGLVSGLAGFSAMIVQRSVRLASHRPVSEA